MDALMPCHTQEWAAALCSTYPLSLSDMYPLPLVWLISTCDSLLSVRCGSESAAHYTVKKGAHVRLIGDPPVMSRRRTRSGQPAQAPRGGYLGGPLAAEGVLGSGAMPPAGTTL